MSEKSSLQCLKDLPSELLIEIFRFSSTGDVFKRLVLTCREFYHVIKTEVFFNLYMKYENISSFKELKMPKILGQSIWAEDLKVLEHPETQVYTYKTFTNHDPWGMDSDEEEIEVEFTWKKKILMLKPKIGFFEDIPMTFYYDRNKCYVRYGGMVEKIKSYATVTFERFVSKALDFIIKPPVSYEKETFEKFHHIFQTQKESKLKKITVTVHPTSYMKKTTFEVPECIDLDQFFLYLGYHLGRTFEPNHCGIMSNGDLIGYSLNMSEIENLTLFPKLKDEDDEKHYFQEKNIFIHYFGNEGGAEILEEKIDLHTTNLHQFDLFLREKFGLKEDSFILMTTCRGGRSSHHPQKSEVQMKASNVRQRFRRRRRGRENDNTDPSPTEHPKKINALSCLLREDRAFPVPYWGKRKECKGENYKEWDTRMEYLYQNVESYQQSLSENGFKEGEYVQFFEVTGPSLPVCYCSMVGDPNVVDINPDWTVHQFLRYCGLVSGHVYTFSYIEKMGYDERETMDFKTTFLKDVIDIEESRKYFEFINLR